jgi:RNA polymerase sigma factor (sigma-70 family)
MARLKEETGLTEKQILKAATNLSLKTTSLDKPLPAGRGKESEGTLYDVYASGEEDVEEACIRADISKKVRIVVEELGLTEREAYVLEKRYLDGTFQTLEEIGKDLNLTRERVRQIESSIIDRLRKRLAGRIGDFLPGVDSFASNLF